MPDLRVGLLGFGLAGQAFHAPLINAVDGLTLAAISTRKRQFAHQHWPRATIFETPEALLDRADVDAVVVATPNHLHFQHARRALECGWHVVVDKPFTVTSAEADELIQLARSKERTLTVYQNRRWDGDFLTIRRLIDTGRLGHIHSFDSHFDRFRPEVQDRWKEQDLPGTGLLYDLGPHMIDQALVLFEMPEWIHAQISVQREGSTVDDFFHLMLGYPQRTVVLSAGTLVREPRPRFRLDGRRGSFIKYGLDPQEASLRAGGDPREDGFGREDEAHFGRLVTVDGEDLICDGCIRTLRGRYIEFYEGFTTAIRDGAPPPVPPEAARKVIRIIESARQSDAEGRRVWMGERRDPASHGADAGA